MFPKKYYVHEYNICKNAWCRSTGHPKHNVNLPACIARELPLQAMPFAKYIQTGPSISQKIPKKINNLGTQMPWSTLEANEEAECTFVAYPCIERSDMQVCRWKIRISILTLWNMNESGDMDQGACSGVLSILPRAHAPMKLPLVKLKLPQSLEVRFKNHQYF